MAAGHSVAEVAVLQPRELAGRDRLREAAACDVLTDKLTSIGFAHLAVAPMHEALSAMSIEELEPHS